MHVFEAALDFYVNKGITYAGKVFEMILFWNETHFNSLSKRVSVKLRDLILKKDVAGKLRG